VKQKHVKIFNYPQEQKAEHEDEDLMRKGAFTFVFCSAFLIPFIAVVPSLSDNTFFNTAQAHSATIPVGIRPGGITYDPSNDRIYVANIWSSTVSVINGSTNSVIDNILVGRYPLWPVYVPSNNQIYVTNAGSNDTYVINATTNRVVKSIAVGTEPFGIAYDPTNKSVYVVNLLNNTLSVIDTATDVVVSIIPLGSFSGVINIPDSNSPSLLAYANDNNALYISKSPFAVSIVNSVTNAAIDDILLGTTRANPFGIAYNPTNHNIYVTKSATNQVSMISTITNSIVANISVGTHPADIVYNPINHNMYVANQGSNTVSVIDSATNTVISTIPAGSQPTGITYNSSNRHLYVTNIDTNTVTMIHP
jgi:YVTN family beta-propeller protein